MTLKKWVHDPLILCNVQPFLKGHGDSGWSFLRPQSKRERERVFVLAGSERV